MKNLTDLLRNLLYHCKSGRQGGGGGLGPTIALAIVGFGVVAPSKGVAIFAHAQQLLHVMVYLIGSAVVLNVTLRHGNELLRRLIAEEQVTRDESRELLTLLKRLLGFKPPDDPAKPPDNGAHEDSHDSKSHDG